MPEPEPDLEPVIEHPVASFAPEGPGIRPRVRGFGVNVGLFSVAANAERAKARLSEAGLPVLDDPVESARGPLTRVRVGPFEQREQAEAAAKAVRALGLEARVYNLFDEAYAEGFYNDEQWILGRPRSFDVSVRAAF